MSRISFALHKKSSIHKAQNEVNFDLIGKPDPVSNLRPIIFKKSHNESKLEKKYREAREEVQLWNHTFWTKHNKSFIQVKLMSISHKC